MQITANLVLLMNPCETYQSLDRLGRLVQGRTEISHRELAQLRTVPSADRRWILYRLLLNELSGGLSAHSDEQPLPLIDSFFRACLLQYYEHLQKDGVDLGEEIRCKLEASDYDRLQYRTADKLDQQATFATSCTRGRQRNFIVGSMHAIEYPKYLTKYLFFEFSDETLYAQRLGAFRRYQIRMLVEAIDRHEQQKDDVDAIAQAYGPETQ